MEPVLSRICFALAVVFFAIALVLVLAVEEIDPNTRIAFAYAGFLSTAAGFFFRG